MKSSKLNILILTASFGNGHKSVANTLKDAFNENENIRITICDLYQEAHPIVNSVTKHAYIKSYDHGHLYSLYYNGIEKLAHSSFGFWYRELGKDYLMELISLLKPDMILNTFPVMVSSELKRKYSLPIPIYSIITDYCVHKIWLNQYINKYYIAHEDLISPLIDWGIKNEQIYVSGIPIKKDFEAPIHHDSMHYLRSTYGMSHKKIVLVNAGAFGVMKDITSICTLLDKLSTIQTVVICGNNDKLKETIEKRHYKNILPLGYIHDVYHFYQCAHCLITKPGGITLSEATSCTLPLIFFNPVPGQETHNATFFKMNGAGLIANDKEEVLQGVQDLLYDHEKYNRMKEALKDIYHRNAAQNIVKDILQEANAHYAFRRSII
ncbi:MAG: MGDG synthase family glycosyltransferase [Eubacteriales bacterium]